MENVFSLPAPSPLLPVGMGGCYLINATSPGRKSHGKTAQEDLSKGNSKLASPLGFHLDPQTPSVSCEETGRSCFHGTRTKHYERRRGRKGGQQDSENKCDVSMVCVFVVCVV